MGLDMYMTGVKIPPRNYDGSKENKKVDGFRLASMDLEIGYWRKHANLHGFIVQTFADGEDRCQEITLGVSDLKEIIAAVEDEILPHTEGFFFRYEGYDPKEEKANDLRILRDALAWLEETIPEPEEGFTREFRYVKYEASW